MCFRQLSFDLRDGLRRLCVTDRIPADLMSSSPCMLLNARTRYWQRNVDTPQPHQFLLVFSRGQYLSDNAHMFLLARFSTIGKKKNPTPNFSFFSY